ncbi:MAG: hypothetical protein KGL43_25575, partial [Burkholderiales bacterium]|nr:hypothetical protein [Burkholderiales bacterium]
MLQRWWSFAVWALVALSAFFWGLHWVVATARAPAGTRVVALDATPRGDLTRLFGAAVVAQAAAPAPEAARFKLLGVVAPRPGAAQGEGLALIAVDGKLARSYRPGAKVDGDWVLQSVQMRGASLGPAGGATRLALEIPPPAAAAVGVPGTLPPPSALPQPAPLP